MGVLASDIGDLEDCYQTPPKKPENRPPSSFAEGETASGRFSGFLGGVWCSTKQYK